MYFLAGMNNMLVKARPLSKLCEYKGGDLPEGYKSDCYGNVDETVYACKEKRRIMVSLIKKLQQNYLISLSSFSFHKKMYAFIHLTWKLKFTMFFLSK